jgi:Holliday junction resolvase RusA-like endonuclease
MHRLEITLPLPAPALSPNARKHWGPKAKAVAKARGDAYLAATDAIARQKPEGLPWESATAQPVFYFRDRRRRDRDNCGAMLKAYFDALQDAGVIVNDSGLAPLPPTIEIDKADPRVVLVVTKARTW